MADGVSNDPVIASTPTPISVEPRAAAPAEVAEVARQAEEAKIAAVAKDAPAAVAKAEPVAKPSIRDAIRAAEKKVNEPAKPLSVAAAEPVAAVAKDAKAAEPASAAKEPAAVTRGEDGKFVSTKPAEPAPAAEVAKVADPAAKAAEPAKPVALPSHTAEPPPTRFSAAAKEKWAEAPDEVRAEAIRMEKEFTAGFAKYKTAAERDGSLAEFHDLAGKSGKHLKDVVSQYVGMENLLRTDTIKGLELICQNAGLSLRDVAAKVLGQTPDAAASAADARVIALEAQNAELKQKVDGILAKEAEGRTLTTTEAVTKFAADNPRFEELSDDIAFFLKSGKTKDLAEAYKLAERLNPAPSQATAPAPEPVAAVASSAPAASALPKPTLVPASTAGEKSITGAPTAGSDPVRKQPSSSIKEAIRRATAAAR